MPTVALVGVMVIDCSTAAVTVTVAVAEIEPQTLEFVQAAVIVDIPVLIPAATPFDATVTAAVFEDVQVTSPEISWVVLSENVPSAFSACDVPAAILAIGGVTTSDTRSAGVTVNVGSRCISTEAGGDRRRSTGNCRCLAG